MIECQEIDTTIDNPMRFALAGDARFTLVSKKTEMRFTFRVAAPKTTMDGEKLSKEAATIHFVSVLCGPDNSTDYRYLGFLRRGVYFHGGAKAKVGQDAPSAKAFDWFWRIVASGRPVPDVLEVHHCGQCGRCGKALTVPESIRSGYGPECITKV